MPVGGGKDKNHGVGQNGEGNAGNQKILRRNVAGAVGNHILGCIHRKDVAEADGVLKNHGHAQHVDARRLHALEDRNDDRNHG